MKKFKKVMSAVLITAVLITSGVGTQNPANGRLATAGSASASGSISENNNRIKQLQEKAAKIAQENKDREQRIASMRGNISQQAALMREVNDQIKQIEAQIKAYTELMDAKQALIDRLEREIAQKELEIENTINRITQRGQEIERLDDENNQNIEKFGQIIAHMYMNSGSDAIGLLTGSTSFYDLFIRAEVIKNIGERNADMMETLLESIQRQEDAIDQLQQDKLLLEEEQTSLETQQRYHGGEQQQLRDERAAVAAEVERQYASLRSLTSQYSSLQSSVSNLTSQVSSASNQLKEIQKEVAELEAMNKKIEEEIRKQQNQNNPVYSHNNFIWPVPTQYRLITSSYGPRTNPYTGMHNGMDIGNSGINGASIFSVQSGTVLIASGNGAWNGGYGNYVVIDHGGGYSTLYAHMQTGSVTVSRGQSVTQGQTIGKVGNTGRSTGPHLHFEVRINGTATNPAPYLANA